MNPITYLDSLIAAMEMNSEIPVQLSELQMLRTFILQERASMQTVDRSLPELLKTSQPIF